MCWNPQISLSTFIFGCAVIAIGYINGVNDIWWSFMGLSFVTMQLVEYFIWIYLHDAKVNRVLSMIGLTIILIQPIVAGLLITSREKRLLYMALYAVFVIAYMISSAPFLFKTVRAKNGHLGWLWLRPGHWIFAVIWLVFVCSAFWLSAASVVMKWVIILATCSLMAVSWWFYKYQEHSWGSVFCSFANLVFVFILAKSFWRHYCGVK